MTAPCHGVAEGEDGSLEEHCVRRALRLRQKLKAEGRSSKPEGLLLKAEGCSSSSEGTLLIARRAAPNL